MLAPVHIHAGGHRTGSSAFQAFLDLNAAAIRDQRVDLAYPDRDGAAGGKLRLWLPAPRHGAQAVIYRAVKARHNVRLNNPDPSRPLILSEENVAGRMTPFYSGRFFPGVARNADYLSAVLGERPVGNFLILVRSYDEMFVSAFRKRAEEHDVGPFNRIRKRMSAFEGGWPQVVQAFRDHLKPRQLIVLPYARRRSEADMLGLLCPELNLDGFRQPRRKVNKSLSDIALFALQERYRLGEPIDRGIVEELQETFDGIESDAPFAAFTPEQADGLRARFRDDLEILRRMDGVRYLEPQSAG